MATNVSRSQTASLDEGATDGRYRKSRPDTQVVDTFGAAQVTAMRESLHPFMNYGYTTQQYQNMQNPGK